MKLSFENKVALVTGAATGMGLATAQAFAIAFPGAELRFNVCGECTAGDFLKDGCRTADDLAAALGAAGAGLESLQKGLDFGCGCGRLLIADIRGTRQHQAQLAKIGMSDVTRRRLGWRFWWGGPWAATRLVTATNPTSMPQE